MIVESEFKAGLTEFHVCKDPGDNVVARVSVHEAFKIIYLESLPHNYLANFTVVDSCEYIFKTLTDALKQYGYEKVLGDSRALTHSFDEGNEWMAKEGFPMLYAAGMKKNANLLPENIYAQLSVDFMTEANAEAPFDMGTFDRLEDAVAWLVAD